MRRIHKTSIIAISCALFCAGCTTVNVQNIPPQDGVYPKATAPDAPFVLAIPGLVVPGLPVQQEQHFGYLVQMLAEEGIPCRVLLYNTPQDPVVRKAALYSPDLSIAATRVGPAMVRELEKENERRAAFGLPPVKKLVIFGYSQGGVILAQLGKMVFFRFRKSYDEFVEKFGDEWRALQKDPEFENFINALDDYIVVKNIRDQYPKLFADSPALRHFDERVETKLDRSFEHFFHYLIDPSTVYPNVKKFDGPGTPYYPKMYDRIRKYAAGAESRSDEERKENLEFFKTYAQYRSLLDVDPYFITASASLFGSPQANATYVLTRIFPWIKWFLGREFYQIKQTMMGSTQQLERIETLVKDARDEDYPIDPTRVLFMLGANGEKGDGLVDQPAAHLSRHSYRRMRAVDDPEKGKKLVTIERERLPARVVVPLTTMHFPEKVMWGLGGTRYGTAYMVKGNPSYPYLLNFIRGDWEAIDRDLSKDDNPLMQFMVQITFDDAEMRRISARREKQSGDIRITGRYFNPGSDTLVWTGYFKGAGVMRELQERMKLLNPVPLVPGVGNVLCREGEREACGAWEGVKARAELLNPVPLIPGAEGALEWTKGLVGAKEEGEAEGDVRFRAAEPKAEITFDVRLPGGQWVPLTATIYPGCISTIRIITGEGKTKKTASR